MKMMGRTEAWEVYYAVMWAVVGAGDQAGWSSRA